MDFHAFEERIGYKFKDPMLLQQALVHSSYPMSERTERGNDRLEYLGDAVLNFIIALLLYEMFKDEGAGFLSNARSVLVRRDTLTEIARKLDLQNYMLFRGEQESLHHSKVLSNMLEALLGAVLLDGGVRKARSLVRRLFLPYMKRAYLERKDPKNALQEVCQRRWRLLPKYRVREGKDGFIAYVSVKGFKADGRGRTKKEAEENAAEKLLLLVKGER